MSLARLLTDTVTVTRPTPVQDDYGSHDTWADVGDPIPCRLQLTSSFEQIGNRDTVAAFRTCTMLGHPDVRPDDVLRDQHGRSFPIEGELDFQQDPAGRLKFTVARLRSTADL